MNKKFLEDLRNRYQAFSEINEMLKKLGVELNYVELKLDYRKQGISLNGCDEIKIIAKRYIDSCLETPMFFGECTISEEKIIHEAEALLYIFFEGYITTDDFVSKMNIVIEKMANR